MEGILFAAVLAVSALESQSFSVRHRANAYLDVTAPLSVLHLRAATQHHDPEVRGRATASLVRLKNWHWGERLPFPREIPSCGDFGFFFPMMPRIIFKPFVLPIE